MNNCNLSELGGVVKKTVLFLIVILALSLFGCSKESALDRIIQEDPEYRANILGKLLSYEDTRQELADTIFADQEIFPARIDSMCQVERSREMLLQHILAADSTGEWIVGKLAENPDIKQKMRSASRR
jgi:hypothetical protein